MRTFERDPCAACDVLQQECGRNAVHDCASTHPAQRVATRRSSITASARVEHTRSTPLRTGFTQRTTRKGGDGVHRDTLRIGVLVARIRPTHTAHAPRMSHAGAPRACARRHTRGCRCHTHHRCNSDAGATRRCLYHCLVRCQQPPACTRTRLAQRQLTSQNCVDGRQTHQQSGRRRRKVAHFTTLLKHQISGQAQAPPTPHPPTSHAVANSRATCGPHASES